MSKMKILERLQQHIQQYYTIEKLPTMDCDENDPEDQVIDLQDEDDETEDRQTPTEDSEIVLIW